MSDQASAVHGSDRGFAKLDLELNDYPGPVKTALFGIQHVLVMFTAMVGGPLIVARLRSAHWLLRVGDAADPRRALPALREARGHGANLPRRGLGGADQGLSLGLKWRFGRGVIAGDQLKYRVNSVSCGGVADITWKKIK